MRDTFVQRAWTLYWEMFYEQPCIAILIYLHDYDMKPLCLRLENSQKQHCSSNMGQPNKYLAIKSLTEGRCTDLHRHAHASV